MRDVIIDTTINTNRIVPASSDWLAGNIYFEAQSFFKNYVQFKKEAQNIIRKF